MPTTEACKGHLLSKESVTSEYRLTFPIHVGEYDEHDSNTKEEEITGQRLLLYKNFYN